MTWFLSGLLILAASPAWGHQANTSHSVTTFDTQGIRIDLTFALESLTEICRLDADADRTVTMEELEKGYGLLHDCIAPYFTVTLDHHEIRLKPRTDILQLDPSDYSSVVLSYQAPLNHLVKTKKGWTQLDAKTFTPRPEPSGEERVQRYRSLGIC